MPVYCIQRDGSDLSGPNLLVWHHLRYPPHQIEVFAALQSLIEPDELGNHSKHRLVTFPSLEAAQEYLDKIEKNPALSPPEGEKPVVCEIVYRPDSVVFRPFGENQSF